MSKFFKALERAEEEQALQQARRRETDPVTSGPNPPGVSLGEPPQSPLQEAVGRLSPSAPAPKTAGERGEGPSRLQPHSRFSVVPLPSPQKDIPQEDLDGIDEHFVSLLAPSGFEAEHYRTLRYMVERAQGKNGSLCVVAVSSPAPGDGKTTTAINLAGALTQATETRVLLVDADLRRPSVSQHLGLGSAGNRGLVDAILNPGLGLHEVVRLCRPFNLAILPAGRSTTASYEILKAPRLGELLAEARRSYDYIVLDTPPLIPFPDCRLIGKWVDGFFMIVAAHKTPRKLVEEALEVVDPAQMLGLVFNGDDRPVFGYSSYYTYGPAVDGHGARRLSAVAKKVGGLLRRGSARREPGQRRSV